MKAIVLSLEAPLRSWGALSLGDDRGTLLHPTSSGAVGFLGACAGVARGDRAGLERWFGTWAVISASEPIPDLLVDYQTARDSRKMDGTFNEEAVISLRSHLLSSLECIAFYPRDDSEDLLEAALEGLRAPVYTPYLGRRSCPLMAPPRPEVVESADMGGVVEALLRRWGNETGARHGQPRDALLTAPYGVLPPAPPATRSHIRFIADERSGWRLVHASAPKEFQLVPAGELPLAGGGSFERRVS